MNKEKSKILENNKNSVLKNYLNCNMKRNSKESQRGITLIALVITVVVMLILAGVSISVLIDGEGLFDKTREAKTVYENGVAKEEDLLSQIINSNYWYSEDGFDEVAGINSPDVSQLPSTTTKYVTWTWSETEQLYNEDPLSETQPTNWYDYEEGKWANIKSTANNLEAYWVWIPRFAYRLPESETPTQIEVAFVKGNSKTVVLENGTEVEGYFATEKVITEGSTGLYIDATDFAKGINGQEKAWIIHPAFTFGDKQLNGIWVAKYEASSSNHEAINGGNNVTDLEVQVKPNVTSWRDIQLANMFTVCQNMVDVNGVIGINSDTLDSHVMKNIEWGAVAILSQSKYGVFNPNSTNSGQVWNNPNTLYLTGQAGNSANDENQSITNEYNTELGVNASTTGTVYGIYDMAGCAWEAVMGLIRPDLGIHSNAGFVVSPDDRYYDTYMEYSTSEPATTLASYNRGKIGDLTKELHPMEGKTWNEDDAVFSRGIGGSIARGNARYYPNKTGIFAFQEHTGARNSIRSFRPVLVNV